MFAYARLTPGVGFKPARAIAYYAQRALTHPPLRWAMSAAIAGVVRACAGRAPWPLTSRGEEALRDLRRDGVARLDPLLTSEQARAMRAYFEAQPVVTSSGETVMLDELAQNAPAAAYALQTILACPNLLAVLNGPLPLSVSSAYLGCKPTLSSVGVRWTFPVGQPGPRFQDFHRDVDDWRFLKLFIYLTDVDERSGPHMYVRGSHRTGFSARSEVYSPEKLEERYGREAIDVVTGPAGVSFMADTLGVHRGGRPMARPRLILQAQYSLLPVFAFLYDPQAQERGLEVDDFCNRLVVRPRRGEPPRFPVPAG